MTRHARTGSGRASALTIMLATAAFAGLHTLLATRLVKDTTCRLAGERARNGWYRVLYNAQALATFGAVVTLGRRLPDRTLYEVRGRARALMRAGQVAGALLAVGSIREVGLGRMAGTASLALWLHGAARVPKEPEAQGPAPDARGRMNGRGPFAYMRHPLNLAPLPILWLQPRMTANLAAFNAAATAYFVVGSWHEERRLIAAYGDAYEHYRRSGVPFYLPW